MKYLILSSMALALILSGCDEANKQLESNAATPVKQIINAQSVWQGDVESCMNAERPDQCVIDKIKANGTESAVAAAQYIASSGEQGYISNFEKFGQVGLAITEYPFRANNNSSYLLVPSSGEPIDISNLPKSITNSTEWLTFQKNHPQVEIWDPATLVDKQQDEITSFTFSYPIKTCRACEEISSLYIKYNFDVNGRYQETELVKID